MKLVGFYHAVNTEVSFVIAREQLQIIKDCHLDLHMKLFVLYHGGPNGFRKMHDLVKELKLSNTSVILKEKDMSKYEFTTLSYLKHYCDTCNEQEAGILYFHQKGATYPTAANKEMRHQLQYWTLVNWRMCVTQLYKGYDTVGFFAGTNPHNQRQWIPGNFWWAKLSHIRKLPLITPPDNVHPDARFSCEHWIGFHQHKSCNIVEIPIEYNEILRIPALAR